MAKKCKNRICSCCGDNFEPKTYNQKYCNKCRERIEIVCSKCGRIGYVIPCDRHNKKLDLCKSCYNCYVFEEKYGMRKTEYMTKKFQERYGLKSTWQLDKTKESIRKTNLERYGVDNPQKNKDIHEKTLKTRIEKYGDTKMFGTKSFQNEYEKNCMEKYGVKNGGGTEESIKKIKESIFKNYGHTTSWGCSEPYLYEGITFDSSWELAYYIKNRDDNVEIKRSDKIYHYEYNGKKYNYYPDFEIGEDVIEIKGTHFFEDGKMINPYNRKQDDFFEAKYQCMKKYGVKLITDVTDCIKYVEEKYGKEYIKSFKNNKVLFGLHKSQVIDFCLRCEFPGTNKWEKNHPIWKCNVSDKMSPYDAWMDDGYIRKAVNNLYKILDDSIKSGKYEDFVRRHKIAFESCVVGNDEIVSGDELLRLVLDRFTIAKIAPKVTALRKNDFIRIIDESGIDISRGVYCPMAGFGGIIEGCKEWFNKKGLSYEGKIEAYDINDNFCRWYGWNQKDVLSDYVVTDKIVVVCPPFGDKYEHWEGTPREMSNKTFLDWVSLIKEHIKAPNYIFIGPELDEHSKNKCGLFKRKVGIQYYKEFSSR